MMIRLKFVKALHTFLAISANRDHRELITDTRDQVLYRGIVIARLGDHQKAIDKIQIDRIEGFDPVICSARYGVPFD